MTMMTIENLMNRVYACTHLAADGVTDALAESESCSKAGIRAQAEALRARWPEVVRELRNAVAAAEAMQRLLAGVPPPKVGD